MIQKLKKLKIKFLMKINITTLEFNKLTKGNFDERLKHAHLASKNDIDDFKKRQIVMINQETLIIKILQIKQNM